MPVCQDPSQYFSLLFSHGLLLFSKVKRILTVIAVLLPLLSQAQIGGQNVYDFLNLTPAARASSLGGYNITTFDHDANFAYQNPALLNDSMHQMISLSFVDYLGGISYGYGSYAHSFEGIGDFHAGVQYVGYGEMIQSDILGNQIGTFGANDLALVVGGARQVDNFRAGLNMKFINSSISGFQSNSALSFDLGGLYASDNGLFTAGMVFKNIGFNLSKWNTQLSTPLPFDIQVGISQRLQHMPLRFSVLIHNINRPNLIFFDRDAPVEFDLSGEPIENNFPFFDNLFRHFIFGTEFLITKGFNLRAGYNHMRRQELRSLNRAGLSGFSFGVGIKIKHIRLDYGLASFHAIGPTHNFSVATSIASWKK